MPERGMSVTDPHDMPLEWRVAKSRQITRDIEHFEDIPEGVEMDNVSMLRAIKQAKEANDAGTN